MKNLKKLRAEKKLTLRELAEKVGVCEHSMFRYEHGTRNPDVETALKIAQALGVSLGELLGVK